MLRICLDFWESEPQYAYKRYAYKKNMYVPRVQSLCRDAFFSQC